MRLMNIRMLRKFTPMPASRNRNRRRIFIGIDPGSRAIGYGVIEEARGRLRFLEAGLLAPTKRDQHYRLVAAGMRKLILRWKPTAVGIEKLLFSRNARTAMGVAEMSGVLKFVMEEKGIAWREFSPPAVKMAVSGSGNAPKRLVGRMASAILGLPKPLEPHHAADAVAVALTLERHIRQEIRQGTLSG
jgi:crossover junction endodeoxyribonuclease RuvC